MKKCPFCKEEIQDDAVKCRYCGSDLTKYETDIKMMTFVKKNPFAGAFFLLGGIVGAVIWQYDLSSLGAIIKGIVFTSIGCIVGGLLGLIIDTEYRTHSDSKLFKSIAEVRRKFPKIFIGIGISLIALGLFISSRRLAEGYGAVVMVVSLFIIGILLVCLGIYKKQN